MGRPRVVDHEDRGATCVREPAIVLSENAAMQVNANKRKQTQTKNS
jgi:hypothetical protein